MAISSTLWQQVLDTCKHASGIVLLVHENPDLDAIGSQLGLYHLLQAQGLVVHMYSKDSVPHIASYLPGSDGIQYGDHATDIFATSDVLIALDCGSKGRMALDNASFVSHTLINIDHHASNTAYGDINVLDASFCATGAMIYDMAISLGLEISSHTAKALYAAVLTDTQRFYNANVNVFAMMADLVNAGADSAEASRHIYGSKTLSQMALLQRALQGLIMRDAGRSSWLVVDASMLQETQTTTEDTEGLIDYARNIAGVDVAVFIRAAAEHVWKVSFRGQGVDVGAMAALLGGGGHVYAAGCTMHGSLDDVMAVLEPKVSAALA